MRCRRAEPSPDDPELAALLVDAGLDVVLEHGHLAGELRGLEVARVSDVLGSRSASAKRTAS